MAYPNPYDDVRPWNTIGFGGIPILPLLVKIGDVKVTDEWKAQKSKETSGQTWVFSGTTVAKPKLTLEAPDKASFDDLRRLWDQLKPVPGQGGGSSTSASSTAAAPTAAVGSPASSSSQSAEQLLAQAQRALAALNNPTQPPAGGSASGSSTTSSAATSNPGPRPATISVQNEILAWHGITAIARGEWEGPTPTETNSWQVVLTVVPQEPPRPAGVGAMAPAASSGPVIPQSNAGLPFPINAITTNASAGAAGT